MTIRIRQNVPSVVLAFDNLRKEQLPFATSLALNIVAATAQDEETAGLFERFQIRRPQRIQTAVRVKAAKKRDLQAVLTIADPFLVQHEEESAIRKPGDLYGSIVQPVRERERRIGVLRGRGTPRSVLRQKKAFVQTMKSGKVGIFVRRGKTWSKGPNPHRLPIDLVFALEREAKLPGLLKFGATVVRVAQRDWAKAFDTGMRRALVTARRR